MSGQDPFAEGSLFSKLIGKSWSSWQLPDQPAESDLKKSKSVSATSVTSNPLGGDYRDLFGTHPDRDYFSLTTCPACKLVMKVQCAGRHFLRDSAGFLVCKDKEQVVSNGKVLNEKPSLPLGTLDDSSNKKIALGVKSSPMGPPAPVQKSKQKKVQSLPLTNAHPSTSLPSPNSKSGLIEAQTINQIKKGRTVIISLPKIIPNQIPTVKNIVNNKTCLEVPTSSQSGIAKASKPVIQQQSALSSPSGALQNYDHPVKFYEVHEKRQRKQKLCTSPSSKNAKPFSSSLPIYEMNEISNPDLDIPGKAKKKTIKRKRTVSSSSSRSDHSSGSAKKQKTDIKPCNVLVKDTSFNPDKHCGVVLPGMSSPCKRNIVCKKKNHSVALRRAVQGRSKPYDDLVSEYKLAFKKEKMEVEKKQDELKKDDLKTPLLPGTSLAEPLPQPQLPILSPPPLLSLPVQPATTEPKKKKPKKKPIKKVSEETVGVDVEPNPNQASPVMLEDVLSEFAHVNINGAKDKVATDPVANTRKSPLFVYPYNPSSQKKFFELWMNESKELFEKMDTQSEMKESSQDKSPLSLRRDNQPSFIKFDGYSVKSKAGGGPPSQEKRKNVFSNWNPCASTSSLNEVETTPPDTGPKSQWVDYSLGVANEENDNDMEILFDFIPVKW